MPEYKSNEWEFQSFVISWLTEFLSTGSYPFDTATANTSLKGTSTTKYPDVLLWLNHAAQVCFCGWELKPPTVPVDESELLKNAAEKAQTIGAGYFVTWNMRDTIIWKTPKQGENVKAEHREKQYASLITINHADDLKNAQHKITLKNRTREILDDLTTLKKKGTLIDVIATPTFFVKILHLAVDNLYPDVESALKKKIGLDKKFRAEIIAWARQQGNNAAVDDYFYQMVARQMVYRLLARIIFYDTLTGTYPQLPKLDLQGLSGQTAIDKLREFFNAAGNIDWTAVFEADLSDKVGFSENSIAVIHKLVDDLNTYNFKLLPHDVIGAVFEQLIPENERHTLGQYFTHENLVDLINAFCIQTTNAVVLDPTCGTGTFLIRAYNKKKTAGLYDHRELLSQLWGVDIANFPAELATINLFRQNVAEISNFPRIVCKDFFEIQPESKHKFPPLKKSPDPNFQAIEETMPLFDAAVGNFPFIRQELIEKVVPHYKDKLEKAIKRDWLGGYPEAFNFTESEKQAIIASYKKGKDVSKYNADFKLSGQADIYAYLFFHTARFIKINGRLGFITANSWLDVAYGYELQKFMLNNFKIIAILESRCEPWFEDAAVNMIITVLERCDNKAERDNHIAKFVKIKKKLAELIPQDIKLQAQERWYHLENLVDTIEKAGEEHLGFNKTGKQTNDLKGMETREDDNFRIRIIKQSDLLDELNTEGKTAKWGQYLRAPEVYFSVFVSHRRVFLPLKDVADIWFGIKTGVNEFFYLNSQDIAHWGIEKEFLVPVIKSPKELTGIILNSEKTQYHLFICKNTKEQLKKANKLGALKYIEYGETQVTKSGVKWSQVPSVSGRNLWWDLGERKTPDFTLIAFVNERFFTPNNSTHVFVSDVFFEGAFHHGIDKELMMAWLNSSFNALCIETVGRTNLGERVLKFIGPEIQELFVLNKSSINTKLKTKIRKAYTTLAERPVKPIFEEVKMKDRQQLDSLILEAMGLDPKVFLKPLYEGLTDLVRERIDLGKMRNKAKKAKVATDTAQIKVQVIEEILPNGVKKFPEDFLEKPLKADECETISVHGDLLKLGGQFMTEHEVFTDNGFKYMASGTDTAKYIVYSQKSNLYLISYPKDAVTASKTVQAYEIYVKDIKEKLRTELANRITDYKLADNLTDQILAEYGLPQIS
jgi:type I restriction-modification system DNA methylase subunit